MRIPQKGTLSMNNTFILSGKYELIQCLGTGSTCQVYLARHTSLEVQRAIKIFAKSFFDDLTVLSEARLLKSLQHPSIPIVYDIEQDDSNYYLVEEFVSGDSLTSYVARQDFISQHLFFEICIQLCDIYSYLHGRSPEPVFYQDLKPEHIILSCGKLKLIDFGASCIISNSGNKTLLFGNEIFSAPEVQMGAKPSVAADVYSIGKLMEYLLPHVETNVSSTIQVIIQKATQADIHLRYETVEDVQSELLKQKQLLHRPHLLQNIAVAESHAGIGSTHLSIAFSSYLNQHGTTSMFVEKNHRNTLKHISDWDEHLTEQTDGSYRCRQFKGFPEYGPGILIPVPANHLYVTDYGSCISEIDLFQTNHIIFLIDPALWNRTDVIAKVKQILNYTVDITLVCPNGNPAVCQFFAKLFLLPVFCYSTANDPFSTVAKTAQVFQQLEQNIGGKLPFSNVKKSFRFHLFK